MIMFCEACVELENSSGTKSAIDTREFTAYSQIPCLHRMKAKKVITERMFFAINLTYYHCLEKLGSYNELAC